ncbi:MAG: lysine--tRNA ligase [Actinomycetaceae bacterium]|nr:lysine--tRNA ligase [Actinomycetaceae bacterium]
MTDTPQTHSTEAPEQIRVRADKRRHILDEGKQAYPVCLPLTATIAEVRERYGDLAPGEETEDRVGVAGRVMFARNTGKLCFATLQQGDGTRIQAMLSAKEVGQDSLAEYKSLVDLGDHIFVYGRVICSRRGELSVMACPGEEGQPAWAMASKALRPLPKTFTDAEGNEVALSEEMRVRNRHLDMIMRPAAREMVRTRYEVVKSLRRYLDEHGFIEVETPMLQTLHGGAAARPFVTHMNAYDTDLYLRIAPELFLKRCVVGGIDKVFEINRNFRNEGADSSHSPEFTMLEAYQTYGTYDTIAELTRGFIQQAARDALGTEVVTLADGSSYDLSGEWAQLDLYGSLSEAVGAEVSPATERSVLEKLADEHGIDYDPKVIDGKLVEIMWEELVGDKLWEPTFVRNFPLDTSPLVRGHRSREGVVEKWDLYVRGFELATGYSELVDPVIQRERFTQQSLLAAGGDPEAMQLDEDFLEAMEAGMPPTGGMGMGLDRLLMALTGQGIRETITFPLVKRETR